MFALKRLNQWFGRKIQVIFIVGLLLLGAAIGFFAGWRFGLQAGGDHSRGSCIREKDYALISPLLGCEIAADESAFQELRPIKSAVADAIAQSVASQKLVTASVYFRLLQSGRWFASNPDQTYAPASLLKVPLMIAYFEVAEKHPAVLSQMIVNDGSFDSQELPELEASKRIHDGQAYTVAELIDHMIIDSSNVAMYLLDRSLDQRVLQETYDELEIPKPDVNRVDFMTVRAYSFFFRILYSSTYLDRDFSQRALQILTRTNFDGALTAKLPHDTVVAHKFGSRIDTDVTPPIGELHDCGIVYYPDHPYILCVMTKAYDSEAARAAIADISSTAYNAVKQFFAGQNTAGQP